jgi:hypothetical protein
MSEGGQASRIETFLYDAEGNRTEDESVAVRGETVELDSEGRVLARRPHDGLDWQVDPKSLEWDEGELATRPGKEGD